ncbi:MAG TPA: NYN domain-containing protein [Ktedonobacterales bacterium]|nr:NYN domain-containing protein [Ktedonobacterales bacterium]
MSQSTLEPNLAPEGSPSEPSAARQGNATHRRRRPASHKTQQPHPEQATPASPAGESAATPETSVVPVTHPKPSQPDATAPAGAPPETTETSRARPGGRSRRRTPSGRKSDVQLVISPATGGDNAAETATAQNTPITPTADVRVVPVTMDSAAPTTPLASEPAAQAVPATETPTALRRYRFDRKATAAPYAPASRPERLSGVLTPPPSAEPEVLPEPAPEPAFESTAREVAEAHPEFGSADLEGAAPEEETPANDAIDDIVSALGLRDAAPRREPLRLPVEPTAPAVEDAEAEAGEPSDAEIGTATDTETAGTTRRRRRRRRGGSHTAGAGEEDAEEMLAAESPAEPAPRTRNLRKPAAAPTPAPITEPEHASRNGYEQYAAPEYEAEYEPPYTPYGQAERQPWTVSQGQTQIGQPESPFGSPEPSVVRGFGPQPRGVAGPARETFARTGRTERIDTPPMSSNQLANMVTHALQQQTDRLLNEFRYHPQSPGMTVMFPAFPSTERVGVFVDVANLLYSSRNMRITVDFGKLLEFLRGNRRIIRAHAYAPTNPDPRADQAFLDPVKGLGYRITTKNYKTFASGAKKADMDLDLCMDIVRIVDAGAVDTIVLVSGDSDFLPLLEYCSDHGVRVEVAAFEDAAAAILRQSCDLFINLSMVNDIRM